MSTGRLETGDSPRLPSWKSRAVPFVFLGLLLVLFSALGTWQLYRLQWKLDLIERVEARVQRAPVAAPGPAEWASIGIAQEYLPVQVEGHFLHERETLVQALTTHGSGYWLLTPLQTASGFMVLVNRGFLDPAHRDPASRSAARPRKAVMVTGLLRLSEPRGWFLAENNPAEDRWYARDVPAIAVKRGLDAATLAPYFIDADAASSHYDWPVGGLTVVKFRNAHLGYALTWYVLALMVLFAAALMRRGNSDRTAP